jgi:hypothetical protein
MDLLWGAKNLTRFSPHQWGECCFPRECVVGADRAAEEGEEERILRHGLLTLAALFTNPQTRSGDEVLAEFEADGVALRRELQEDRGAVEDAPGCA